MSEKQNRKPFVNAAEKTTYFFADGMTVEEAYRALLDPSCHAETDETFDSPTGEIYRVNSFVNSQPKGRSKRGRSHGNGRVFRDANLEHGTAVAERVQEAIRLGWHRA